MVVPVEKPDLRETKQYVGNHLCLKFRQNRSNLIVIGNNCSVKINENFGSVKVIGNNSSVAISKCLGSVEYIGNNGMIHFDSVTSQDQVKYIGLDGSLMCKKADKKTSKSNRNQTKFSDPLNEFHGKPRVEVVVDNVRVANPLIDPIALKDLFPSHYCSYL